MTIEKIRSGNSSIRNQAILKYLDSMRYVDALGRGIPMIISEMKERACFEEIGETFSVTLMY
jgi:ATP-dependent DNA helicase RecG